MANCNCNDFPIACAPHAPGGDCCHHPHGCPPHPCPPPNYKGGTSMYIGARYVPIFADPVEWDDVREYEPLTIVTHNGDCYTSKCYVPKGAQLPPYPEGQTKYWVKTSDYNYQFADLKKTVTDLSRLVEQFQKDNERFTELINGWNAQVQQWEKDMTAWGERLDTVESNVSTLTDSLNAEIARAKAAEQALEKRVDDETALREAGDTANKNLIEQEQNRAEGQENAIREEFAAADTTLSNRITANKTDIDAIKAEQAIQNTNISNNAKNISDNSAEIAKHAKRLTDLESNASDWDTIFPDTTIAQEVQKEELARANGDTALNGRCDTIAADVEEVRDIANHKVDTTTYTAGQAAQDAKITTAQNDANKANTNIGNWETDHPGQTISECATSLENEVEAANAKADANATNIGNWNAEHPGKTISQEVTNVSNSIPDVSEFVTKATYDAGQAEQDARISTLEFKSGDKIPITALPFINSNNAYVLIPIPYNIPETATFKFVSALYPFSGYEDLSDLLYATGITADSTVEFFGRKKVSLTVARDTENPHYVRINFSNPDYQFTQCGIVWFYPYNPNSGVKGNLYLEITF